MRKVRSRRHISTPMSNREKEKRYSAVKQPNNPSKLRGQETEIQNFFNIELNNNPHFAFLSDVVRHDGIPLIVMEWATESINKKIINKESIKMNLFLILT